MNEDLWIVVPNWDKFQHYRDRSPAWVKLYLELNSRQDWLDLTFAQRGLLVSIWIEYGRSNVRLPLKNLWARVGQQDRHGNLEALYQAGFIQFSASAPLAQPRASASREKRRVEKNARASAQHQEQRPAASAYHPYQPPSHEPHLDRAAALELARLLAQP